MQSTTKPLTDQYVSKYTPDRRRMSTPLARSGVNLVRVATSHALSGFAERTILHLELFRIQSTINLIYLLPLCAILLVLSARGHVPAASLFL